MQTTLDFTHRENNRDSETFQEENMVRLGKNCQTILAELRKGRRLTSSIILYELRIKEPIRRLHDIMKAGIEVHAEWVKIEGERKFKEYYL